LGKEEKRFVPGRPSVQEKNLHSTKGAPPPISTRIQIEDEEEEEGFLRKRKEKEKKRNFSTFRLLLPTWSSVQSGLSTCRDVGLCPAALLAVLCSTSSSTHTNTPPGVGSSKFSTLFIHLHQQATEQQRVIINQHIIH
jgi:hypothetical protein